MCVGASKFPPLVSWNLAGGSLANFLKGHRSVTMFTAVTQYQTSVGFGAITQVVNDSILIMPMIETAEGVANVE